MGKCEMIFLFEHFIEITKKVLAACYRAMHKNGSMHWNVLILMWWKEHMLAVSCESKFISQRNQL